ncbi:DEKNAAC100683 [Brettanomyces naardenensis]|uniref:Aminomethyltransferase n=1 Tax=Brettanomyces naardenensis TaxID=13370 RepID=A0A448YG24_BRENA|nr:DEKNAAC100683 [Brettanomyces naardenensis]
MLSTRSVASSPIRLLRAYSTEATQELLKTPLYNEHIRLGAKMVPFAGYSMPVLYDGFSHIESHKWTRANCGVFDVSHMLQHRIVGTKATEFLQKLCPTDFAALDNFQFSLSVLLNHNGGIVDDCIVTKHADDAFYMVTNAACRSKDIQFIDSELEKFEGKSDVKHDTFEGVLLAIQGPKAQDVVTKFTNSSLKDLYFGNSRFIDLKGFGTDEKFHVARSGYTGEDGFEISIPNGKVGVEFFNALMEQPDVKPIGLAARDSLRLEAGMCLYGNELNDDTTPIDGSLNWLVSKSRRNPEATFNGAAKILSQIANPKSVHAKRVGITSKGPSPRHGNKIFSVEDSSKQIGEITSGSFGPSVGFNVAQAYIQKPFHKKGTEILVEIRGRLRKATVSKMPFIEPGYYRGE